ncbi:uncharacterized protein [Garra rufa]|uniref:uncharacterized protein n=1 Tax=Garra rufa TaxID=137080 RepID=UPI003CCEC8CF
MEDFQIEIPEIEIPEIEIPEIEVPEGDFCDVEMEMEMEMDYGYDLEMEDDNGEGIEDEESETKRPSCPKARNPKRQMQQNRQVQYNRQMQQNRQIQYNRQMQQNRQIQYNRQMQQNRQIQYNRQMQQNLQGPRKVQAKVKDYLRLSVFTITFCNCLFLGMAALICSLKAINRKYRRDVKGAKKFSRCALAANICAIITTIITIIVVSVVTAIVNQSFCDCVSHYVVDDFLCSTEPY